MFKQKVMMILRKVPKVLGIILLVSAVLFVGFQLFLSIYFKPHDVRLTNVTDTSFTVSWITNYPMRGIVYYKEKDSILPGILSWIGTKRAYDDRDIALAEQECVEKFNKEAKVSEDFVVDTSKYSCNQVKVKKTGKYFTHHATLTDLEPNKEYYFRIGDGIFSYKGDINKSAIFLPLRGEVKAPAPIFGKIVNDKGEYVNDSVVYIKFINGYLGKESMYYSSVTARDGSWYLDSNNIRTIEGEPIIVEDKQDMIKVYAQYQNYILSDSHDWVYGNSGFAYPDIVVKDSWEKDLSALPNEENGIYVGWVKGVSASGLTKGNMVEGTKKLNQILKREHTVSDGSTSLITESVKREGKNKDFREMFVENIQVWEYVLFGVFLLSFVILLIFWLKKRNTAVFFRIRKGYGALQVLLLTVPVVYLGIKVNTVQNLSSEESHAHGMTSADYKKRQEHFENNKEAARSYANPNNGQKKEEKEGCSGCECDNSCESRPAAPQATGNTCQTSNIQACSLDQLTNRNLANTVGIGLVMNRLKNSVNSNGDVDVGGKKMSLLEAYEKLGLCNNAIACAGNLQAAGISKGLRADDLICKKGEDCSNKLFDSNGKKFEDKVMTVDSTKGIKIGDKVVACTPACGNGQTCQNGKCVDSSKVECSTNQTLVNGKCVMTQTPPLSDILSSSATIVKLGNNYYWQVPNSNKKVRLNITEEEAKGLCKGEVANDKCDGVQLLYSQIANIGMLYNILPQYQQTKLTKYIEKTHSTILGDDDSLYLQADGVFIKKVGDHLVLLKNGQPYNGEVTVTGELKKLFPQLTNLQNNTKISLSLFLGEINRFVYNYTDSLAEGDKKGKETVLTENESCKFNTCRCDYGMTSYSITNGNVCPSFEVIREFYNTQKNLGGIIRPGRGEFRGCLLEGGCTCNYNLRQYNVANGESCDSSYKPQPYIQYNSESKKIEIKEDVIWGRDRVITFPGISESEFAKTLGKELESFYTNYSFVTRSEEKSFNNSIEMDDYVGRYNTMLADIEDKLRNRLNSCNNETGDSWSDCVTAPVVESNWKEELCRLGNGNWSSVKKDCDFSVKGISDTVLGTTDSTNTLGSGYITYLPEYGFFDMEIEGLKETEKVEGNTLRIFYVETNGIEGFQIPADPDNPKSTEDIMLQSSSLNISYKKSAEVMTLDLKRGVNLVSFNYIPKIENNEYSKASSILKWLVSKGARVEHISYFSGGRWKGIGYVDGKTTGDDFNITPGKGYLIYTEADAKVNIPGYKITSSVPVSLGAGWNLIGVHGYNEMYTARSLIDSINSIDGLTANNVSWWPTSKGKYEGLQVVDGKQYGFDFSISSNNGYFVRISKFAPKDSKCKSLLWHAGGSHNGACGGSK